MTDQTVIYIAGSISDGGKASPETRAKNIELFNSAEQALVSAGYRVLNPARHEGKRDSWLGYMRLSLVDIAQVDGIALLHNWMGSRGARLEASLAEALGIPALPLGQWLHPSRGGSL